MAVPFWGSEGPWGRALLLRARSRQFSGFWLLLSNVSTRTSGFPSVGGPEATGLFTSALILVYCSVCIPKKQQSRGQEDSRSFICRRNKTESILTKPKVRCSALFKQNPCMWAIIVAHTRFVCSHLLHIYYPFFQSLSKRVRQKALRKNIFK